MTADDPEVAMNQPSPWDVVSTVIDRMSASMTQVPDGAERASWLFTRCLLSMVRFENAGRAAADMNRALDDFDALPDDFPSRAKLAAMLMMVYLKEATGSGSGNVDRADFDRACALAEIADADPDPLPEWPRTYAVIRAHVLVLAGRDGAPGFRVHEALAELDRLARTVRDSPPHAQMVELSRLALAHLAAVLDNDVGTAQRLAEEVERFRDAQASGSTTRNRLDVIARMGQILPAMLRGDLPFIRDTMAELAELIDALPAGDPMRAQFEEMRRGAEPFLGSLLDNAADDGRRVDVDPNAAPVSEEHLRQLRVLADRPGQSDTERAMHLATLAGAQASLRTPAALDAAVDLYRQALSLSPQHDPWRVFHLLGAGVAQLARMEARGNRSDLAEGISLLERARAEAGPYHHVIWARSSIPLAQAYRLSGRGAQALDVALSGLRGHAWSVLLQTHTADAHDVARHAAGDALEVAEMCLLGNDAEKAATALEMGRGLILYAAIETRDIATRLARQGDDELARQWTEATSGASAADAPSDLRRRVIGALAGVSLTPDGSLAASPGEATMRLLDPPSLHEIRAALGALGMDALVYLVPGDGNNGAAVLIPAAREPDWVRLPDLTRQRLGAFERFMAERERSASPDDEQRDAYPDLDIDVQAAESAVDEVCDWAWQAAIGPLLDSHLDAPSDRPARIVLVPVRELSRIPWHAARFRDATGHTHHALERAVFSYAASARMFCESAWRRDVSVGETGLIVGDPDTARRARDLPAARSEARAIKDGFYPAARYVGRQPDGSQAPDGEGSPEQIRDWLADPQGGTVVHLACHALVRTGLGPDETSYLLLAQGKRLSAEELVGTLDGTPDHRIAVAVLAACHSAESGRGYDEAFSLATGFLAHNTNSVISAQWSVPDSETSVLMYMFHHNLREQGLRPVDALRQAQLWMLTDRTPPAAMPAELHQHLTNHPTPSTASWAAFIHTGR
jgi:hypothetical protein